VSSHLARQEVQLEMELPTAGSGHDAVDETLRRVTVNIAADGRYLLGSQPVDRQQLAQAIEFESTQHGRELEIRIRCDRQVPYPMVEPVLLDCATHGVWRVSFAVTRRADAP
jgi:biopolymer transport protein ExbD